MTERELPRDGMPARPGGAILLGIAGSHGVVAAQAVVMETGRTGFPRRRIRSEEADAEWESFRAAVSDVQADLREMIERVEGEGPEASILGAYLLMVGDETLAEAVRGQICQKRRCAGWAVAGATSAIARKLSEVDDPYIRKRGYDVEFVGDLLIRALAGEAEPDAALDVSEPSIVVAHDLSPADTAAMMTAPIVGFVTEVGSRTSHTAIMARALAIPAVVGVKDALRRIDNGDQLVLDGLRGTVTIDPTDEELEEAERRAARYRALASELGKLRSEPTVTQDGVRVALHANIELPAEARIATDHGAEGVGLYRTEYLYVNRRQPPTEEEQLAAFGKVIERMEGLPVTLRIFDIGGDKFITTFRLPHELNPMLGLRAVRLALAERDLLLEQLRAMVRASALGPVRILVPLVATLEELAAVKEALAEARADVAARGEPMAEHIPLGVMIEVPSAALIADRFAVEADFLSIGTNDLVQYTLAIDRSNRALAYLASPYEPAVLRLIDGVIRAGRDHDCPVSLCGEMASSPLGALLLVGFGL
ncbi:MAG: phosphoenolpyruvate--protein phosphotransferase, partial [Deltaproteobacteria bacterium]|nr:phosphoenolpyruvate--protein phosphotransferase [Deltaproteobacteria bacterium]